MNKSDWIVWDGQLQTMPYGSGLIDLEYSDGASYRAVAASDYQWASYNSLGHPYRVMKWRLVENDDDN